jgi:hypothetical protein
MVSENLVDVVVVDQELHHLGIYFITEVLVSQVKDTLVAQAATLVALIIMAAEQEVEAPVVQDIMLLVTIQVTVDQDLYAQLMVHS